MVIYKITNKLNNKFYIGQTIHTVEARWKRHIEDAMNGLNTHFAKAIRKYGYQNFEFEVIDTANNSDELTEKEYYWINYYDAINKGYNETASKLKCGGNTYLSKTPEEMKLIKNKIRQTKLGKLNPNAKAIKIKNYYTGEEIFFDSCADCQRYFNETNHNFITRRCQHKTHCLYKKQWYIAYHDEEYDISTTVEKNNAKSVSIQVLDLEKNEVKQFQSFASAKRFYNWGTKIDKSKFKGKDELTYLHYKITLLH